MKALKLMSYALLLASLASCGASARKDTETKPVEQKDTADAVVLTENTENAATLITSVYDTFVFLPENTIPYLLHFGNRQGIKKGRISINIFSLVIILL